MSTKGYRQPYTTNECEVWFCLGRERRLEWVAPDRDQAMRYADAAIAEWQIKTYGHVDPYRGNRAVQTGCEFGFGVMPPPDELDRIYQENRACGALARSYRVSRRSGDHPG